VITFTFISIFPKMFESPLGHSILHKARDKGLIEFNFVDPRSYATDKHKMTDDYPYGGGQGMVMKVEPLVAAIETVKARNPNARVALLAPQGKPFSQTEAQRLATESELVLICGRYEGVDERVKAFIDEEISVGDYTLSGGEPAALVVTDAVARLIPGVLGNENSAAEESFTNGLLEYPQYTRPEEFRGMKVPDELLSGNHAQVRRWRHEQSLRLTRERRPDLYARAVTNGLADKTTGSAKQPPIYVALLHHPVYDKNHQIVTTAVTNMDIHDISRSACTYGVAGFYVVTPVKALQKLSQKIIDHWETGYGSKYNSTRKEALALARLRDTLDDAIIDIENETGQKPVLVVTSARPMGARTSFEAFREMLKDMARPVLILFGTGWGLTETIFDQADYILEPINGPTPYNHLSVRSAAAIVLDRLLGC
jgi:tRNA (guanine37-N1)-methyltransferase